MDWFVLDKFMRHLLASGLNWYMSSESVLTNLVQVWFNLRKNSSNMKLCPNIENMCWTIMIPCLSDQNLLYWPEILHTCSALMILAAVEIWWPLDKRYFGFGVELVNYSAAVFSI